MFKLAPHAIASAVICLLPGCSDDGTVTVTGTVVSQGQKLTRGLVAFHGQGKPHGAPIDADGNYLIRIPPGDYTVTISAPALPPAGWREGDPLPEMKAPVNARYALPTDSELTIEVPANGTHSFDLDLQ